MKFTVLVDSLAACNIIELSNLANFRGVRCAAHTLQLAVDDALKQTALKKALGKLKVLAKFYKIYPLG